MSKKSDTQTSPDQWTPMAEAISFISATLGEPFTTAQAHGLYWGAFACLLDDGTRGYPCALEKTAPDKVRITVSFGAAKQSAAPRLYAIIGWATYHGHEVDWD